MLSLLAQGSSDTKVLFECPTAGAGTGLSSVANTETTTNTTVAAVNYEPFLFKDYENQDLLHMPVDQLVETFRNQVNGDWGKTYEQVKEHNREWKTKYVVPFLQSGHSIYESASGIGLNLLFSMEILAQERPGEVNNLTLYGNEYLPSSTRLANSFLPQVLKHVLPPGMARLGQPICVADSSHLQHLPSDTFDFVYTGYISPILDVLDWRAVEPDLTPIDIHKRFVQLCQRATASAASPHKDMEAVETLERAQIVQQQFYAQWVSEMIRIAKPGQPVVVEQVSQEKCNQITDNGGVAPEWWKEAIHVYRWPVEPDSLAFGKDYVFNTNRYHVFMRKLGENDTNGGEREDEL